MRKRFISVKAIALIVCLTVLVGALAATGCLATGNLVVSAEQSLTVEDELVIAHITDTHYYPLTYTYNGTNKAGTDYESRLISGTKLFLESSLMNIQMLRQIETQAPDYLVVTGDITLDGELQSHVEMANLLRRLQNNVREKKPNFQVFVSFGNHDMYNPDTAHFRDGGKETILAPVTRYDMTKIYSSLGYPDLSDTEIQAYYDSLLANGNPKGLFLDNLPYDGDFVNSTTAANVTVEYQYEGKELTAAGDYYNGDISYVAYAGDYVFLAIDEELSNAEIEHHVGGAFFDSTADFFLDLKDEGKFDGKKNMFALSHHNLLPHFPLEETLLKDFTLYGWAETADFLADELGVGYVFTGHMHSNDIETRISFGGNVIHDMETSSATGYLGGARYAKIQMGTIDGKAAQNLHTWVELVNEFEFSVLIDGGYLDEEYLDLYELTQYLEERGGKTYCIDASEYAVNKLFRNIVKSLLNTYVTPAFIGNLGDMVQELIEGMDNDLIGMISGFASRIVNNLITHFDQVVLADYEYKGNNPLYMTDERGAKLCGYIEDMVYTLLNMKVNSAGDTLFDFGMGGYLAHVGGIDKSAAATDPRIFEGLANLKNGSIIQQFVDLILNEEIGLLRIVKGLLLPINLSYGMDQKTKDGLDFILSILVDVEEVDSGAFKLDDFVQPVLNKLEGMGMDIGFSLGGQTISEYIDEKLGMYLPQSFILGFGEIGYDIVRQFYIDETSYCENSFDGYKLYKYDASLPVTNYVELDVVPATVENGKLPSMINVTFGPDPATEKNFVWFTDRRVSGTEIQYSEGEFNAATAAVASGEFEVYATTTASIDLIIFSTLMYREVGRHTVELRNLKPGTTYSYRVGSAADNFWSDIYTFKTGPADNSPFEVLLMTDLQGSVRRPYEILNEMLGKMGTAFPNGYDFVLNTGDLVDNSRHLSHWEYLLNIPGNYWRNTTQVVAIGNHEGYYFERQDKLLEHMLSDSSSIKDPFNYFNLHYNYSYPENTNLRGVYYSFDYSGVHFTVLNTNDLGDAQVEWLTEDLASTDKVKVVLMHRGIYTAGIHSTDGNIERMREILTPIFADNGVSLVLAGHDHTYSESYYLDRYGKPVENSATGQAKIGGEGVLYITLGCTGDKFYGYTDNEDVPLEFGKTVHDPALKNPTFGRLVYDGTDLYYYGYEYDLETGEIKPLRRDAEAEGGLLWWHWLLIGVGCAAVIAGGTVTTLVLLKKKKAAAK